MFKRLSVVGYEAANGLHRFICDYASDILTLPNLTTPSSVEPVCWPCNAGSTAIVLEEMKEYMLNNQNEWVYYKRYGNAGDTDQAQKKTKKEKDVNFYDYDGTLIGSYTASDVANWTVMPANPTHSGLTSQGWNYSLGDLKTEVASSGKCNVGQMYVTDDGKSRVYITLEEDDIKDPFYVGLGVNGTVEIDWGDWSATETLSGSSETNVVYTSAHAYANAGDYVITIEVKSGTFSFYSNSGASRLLRRYIDVDFDMPTLSRIKRVEIGLNASIGHSAFYYCLALISVLISDDITDIGSYAFRNCSSLTSIMLPNSLISIGEYAFYDCDLFSISIPQHITTIESYSFYYCKFDSFYMPDSITSIGSYAFHACILLHNVKISSNLTTLSSYIFGMCNNIKSIYIPKNITNIANNAFANAICLREIRFASSTPPILGGSNAFSGLPTNCVIYVPQGSLSAYTSASNYPSSSTYTYVEE